MWRQGRPLSQPNKMTLMAELLRIFIRNEFMVFPADAFCAIIDIVEKSRKAYRIDDGRAWKQEQNRQKTEVCE